PIPTATTPPQTEVLSATGTDGKPAQQSPKKLGPNLGPSEAISGDFARQTETEERVSSQRKNPEKQAGLAVFQGSDSGLSKVEAPGIEPGSRGLSASASTCVACRCLAGRCLAAPPTAFARSLPGKQGLEQTNRP